MISERGRIPYGGKGRGEAVVGVVYEVAGEGACLCVSLEREGGGKGGGISKREGRRASAYDIEGRSGAGRKEGTGRGKEHESATTGKSTAQLKTQETQAKDKERSNEYARPHRSVSEVLNPAAPFWCTSFTRSA